MGLTRSKSLPRQKAEPAVVAKVKFKEEDPRSKSTTKAGKLFDAIKQVLK